MWLRAAPSPALRAPSLAAALRRRGAGGMVRTEQVNGRYGDEGDGRSQGGVVRGAPRALGAGGLRRGRLGRDRAGLHGRRAGRGDARRSAPACRGSPTSRCRAPSSRRAARLFEDPQLAQRASAVVPVTGRSGAAIRPSPSGPRPSAPDRPGSRRAARGRRARGGPGSRRAFRAARGAARRGRPPRRGRRPPHPPEGLPVTDRVLPGIALMLGFCATAPLIDVASKLAAQTLSVGEVTTARFVVQGAIMLPFALGSGGAVLPPREVRGFRAAGGVPRGLDLRLRVGHRPDAARRRARHRLRDAVRAAAARAAS